MLFTLLGVPDASPGGPTPDTSTTFVGTRSPAPQIDPGFDLGADPRELSIIKAHIDDIPPLIHSERISDSEGNTWKVVRRDRNPAAYVVEFWVVLVIDEDQ